MPRDPDKINQQARAAAEQAVTQFKSEDLISAKCPDCGKVISVTYVELPSDCFRTECKCQRSNCILRGVMGPPARVLTLRDYYLKKTLGAGILDITFYATYFTNQKEGGYFGCPIDPRTLLPGVSEETIVDAIQRSKRLYSGNAYVGAAFLRYADEPMTSAEAVEKLKRENPGFCEDVYTIAIQDSIQGMR